MSFIARLYPKRLRLKYRDMLTYAGIKITTSKFITLSFLFSVILTVFAVLFFNILFGFPRVITAIVAFIVCQIFVYEWLVLKADAKSTFIEEILPDALDLMASNLRAGHTTEKALILASRPEFGPLQEELDKAGKDIALGKSIPEALHMLSERIRSEKVEKILQLLIRGVKAGGKLAELLTQASLNLKKQALTEKKFRAAVSVYVMFISFATAIGAPFLFATATFLVETLQGIMGGIEIPTATFGLPLLITKTTIPPEIIVPFVILLLVITSITASLIIGQISRGKASYGFKYMPGMIFVTIILFFTIKWMLGKMLGGLF